jgi:hypothetical protein
MCTQNTDAQRICYGALGDAGSTVLIDSSAIF